MTRGDYIAEITQRPLFKLSLFRDGGGTITTVELGQVTNFDKLLETEGEAIICLVFCEEHQLLLGILNSMTFGKCR